MITERENVLHVINRTGQEEWVPIATKCFHWMIPSCIWERPKNNGVGTDWFGCPWVYDEDAHGYAQDFTAGPPVTDVTEWREQVQFPDLDAVDWEGCAKKDLAEFDPEQQVLEIFWESGPFERSHHLLGFEGAFIAMMEEPDAYKELLDALTDWRIEAFSRLIDAYQPDLIYTHDDLGHARGPFMSVDSYREFLKPRHMRLQQFVRSHDIILEQHSCGCMEPFVGDMIDCGAQIIHPLQGEVNNQEKVVAEHGGNVVFHGGPRPLIHLADTSEEELRAEARRVIDLFAPKRCLIFDPLSLQPGATEILEDEATIYGADYWRRNGL